jgi:hypothetical protein
MWNSGGKNFWQKLGGSAFSRGGSAQEAHPVYPDFPGGVAEIQRLLGADGKGPFEADLGGAVGGQEDVVNFARGLMEGKIAPRNLDYENTMGRLASMGLATSAPGIIESTGQLYQNRVKGAELLQQASQGLAVLKALPYEYRVKLIQEMLKSSQQGAGSTEGGGVFYNMLSSLFSGQGGKLVSSGG